MVNGRFQHCVETSDRGFQYGDGVFTTTPIRSGRAVLLERHLARLARDCARLSINVPDWSELAEEARLICCECADGILKIQVTRGPGGRGYRFPETPRPSRVLSIHPLPRYESSLRENGVCVRICHHRLGLNTALAGVKHMNRLEQILARAEWNDDSVLEGLMLDQEGNVVEGTMSNLFVVRNNQLVTPLLDRCGVDGVMRGLILEIASTLGTVALQSRLGLSDLADAEEIFLTNSVIGLLPVSRVEKAHVAIGPLTRRLGSLVDDAIARETCDR